MSIWRSSVWRRWRQSSTEPGQNFIAIPGLDTGDDAGFGKLACTLQPPKLGAAERQEFQQMLAPQDGRQVQFDFFHADRHRWHGAIFFRHVLRRSDLVAPPDHLVMAAVGIADVLVFGGDMADMV